jgi:hypothetical protein
VLRAAPIAAVIAAALLVGCHEKQELTTPPPPLRPEPEPALESVVADDCQATDPATELKPLSFDERSIPEGARLAEQGYAKLNQGNSAEANRRTREDLQTEAVEDFITALAADPYNIRATYGLAAAYAKIGRKQCSINMLTRMLQMRPHPSKREEVERYIDRLLGRRQALDPDFSDMRRDGRFRELIAKMCEGTNDPNCVYGAQKEGRER